MTLLSVYEKNISDNYVYSNYDVSSDFSYLSNQRVQNLIEHQKPAFEKHNKKYKAPKAYHIKRQNDDDMDKQFDRLIGTDEHAVVTVTDSILGKLLP